MYKKEHILKRNAANPLITPADIPWCSCGAIADEAKDSIRVYYGACDTCIGLAEGSLAELLDECKRFKL